MPSLNASQKLKAEEMTKPTAITTPTTSLRLLCSERPHTPTLCFPVC